MWRIKMFARFIVWLLKQIMKVPLAIVAYTHLFLDEWKHNCRQEFGVAILMYLLTILGSMIGGLLGILVSYGDDATKQMLTNSLVNSFYFATGVFVFVILLASYDKFIEEYERSFNILKEKHDGQI